MLKACSACGRIHDSKFMCAPKLRALQARQKKKGTYIDRFHSSYRWTALSRRIRERDRYLCLACLYDLDGQGSRITTTDLSVHHIVPLSEDWEKRFDEDNLATLCAVHHEAAEAGNIDRAKLIEAVERSKGTGRMSIPPVLAARYLQSFSTDACPKGDDGFAKQEGGGGTWRGHQSLFRS